MKECQVWATLHEFIARYMYHNVFHENNLPDIPSLHDIGIIMEMSGRLYSWKIL
jgi:hypothetical protein